MKTISALVLVMAMSGIAGCGSAVMPKELASARTAYDRAATGPAASLNPTDLHTARESLDAAEKSFEEEGDTPKTRDLSYAAERSAETAESKARAMKAEAETAQIVAQMHAATAQQGKTTSAELARVNQQLASRDQALAAQGVALDDEVKRRQEAERRAAQAAADIAKFASIKQEPRGMVITLSGSVLFTSGQSELLPAAQMKLNEVAKALTEQDPESRMVVEGHTDSQGGVEFNEKLSQQRAQAVRDYLVSRGVAADRITAEGFGPSRNVGDNATAEGRANNRRVEIVVKPKA